MSAETQPQLETYTVAQAREILRGNTSNFLLKKYPTSEHDNFGGAEVWLKDETKQITNSFKARGALVLLHYLREMGYDTVTTFSAGNHAAGVAYAAHKLGMKAVIFMPKPTPQSKQQNVKFWGGGAVETNTEAATLEEAGEMAYGLVEKSGGEIAFAHPFDHLATIAGQATMVAEALEEMSEAPDEVLLPVGGNGAVAGATLAVKAAGVHTTIVGAQFSTNTSLQISLESGLGVPVAISEVDTLCEGSCVKQSGRHGLNIINSYKGNFELTTNDAVDVGREAEAHRLNPNITMAPPEATALLGLAAARKRYSEGKGEGKKLLVVVTGSNRDPTRLNTLHQAYTNKQAAKQRTKITTKPA